MACLLSQLLILLADILAPVLQILLHFRHELAGVGAVDDAVIEAQGQADDAADGDRVGAVFSSVMTVGSLKSPPTPRIALSG